MGYLKNITTISRSQEYILADAMKAIQRLIHVGFIINLKKSLLVRKF